MEDKPNNQLLEIVAFKLATLTGGNDEVWRGLTPAERGDWRQRALAFVEDLAEAGIKVGVGKAATLERAAETLTIIPAKRAYSLAEETV